MNTRANHRSSYFGLSSWTGNSLLATFFGRQFLLLRKKLTWSNVTWLVWSLQELKSQVMPCSYFVWERRTLRNFLAASEQPNDVVNMTLSTFSWTMHNSYWRCGPRRGTLMDQQLAAMVLFNKKCESNRYQRYFTETSLVSGTFAPFFWYIREVSVHWNWNCKEDYVFRFRRSNRIATPSPLESTLSILVKIIIGALHLFHSFSEELGLA